MSNINITVGNLFHNASIHSTFNPSAFIGTRDRGTGDRGASRTINKNLESGSMMNAQQSLNYLSKVTYHSASMNQIQSFFNQESYAIKKSAK